MTKEDDFEVDAVSVSQSDSIAAIYAAIEAVGPSHGGIKISVVGELCNIHILPMEREKDIHVEVDGGECDVAWTVAEPIIGKISEALSGCGIELTVNDTKDTTPAAHGSDGIPDYITSAWRAAKGRKVQVYLDGKAVPNAVEAHRAEGWVDVLRSPWVKGNFIVDRMVGDVTFKEVF